MAKFDRYKDSTIAALLSAIGYLAIGFGVYACANEDFGFEVGGVALAIGFGLKLAAFFLNKLVGMIKRKVSAKKKQED